MYFSRSSFSFILNANLICACCRYLPIELPLLVCDRTMGNSESAQFQSDFNDPNVFTQSFDNEALTESEDERRASLYHEDPDEYFRQRDEIWNHDRDPALRFLHRDLRWKVDAGKINYQDAKKASDIVNPVARHHAVDQLLAAISEDEDSSSSDDDNDAVAVVAVIPAPAVVEDLTGEGVVIDLTGGADDTK